MSDEWECATSPDNQPPALSTHLRARYEEWVVSALGCEAAGAEYRDTATGQLGASVYVGTTAYHSDPGIYEAADWVAPGFEVLEDALVEDAGSSSEEEHVDY